MLVVEGRELRVGMGVGELDVGTCVGCAVGKLVGIIVGATVGEIVGESDVVGWDGIWLGSLDG